jgi:hypothetical protein
MAAKRGRQRRLHTPGSWVDPWPERPPAVQIETDKVMRSEWADPLDFKPGPAKSVRTVNGYRARCALRWCIKRHGERSSFKAEHVVAADLLRVAFDGSRLGFAGLKDWAPVHSILYRPMTGPTHKAQLQLRCRQKFDRCWKVFSDRECALIAGVVLLNYSVAFASSELGISPKLGLEQLVVALDKLVVALDVGRAVAAGRMIAA